MVEATSPRDNQQDSALRSIIYKMNAPTSTSYSNTELKFKKISQICGCVQVVIAVACLILAIGCIVGSFDFNVTFGIILGLSELCSGVILGISGIYTILPSQTTCRFKIILVMTFSTMSTLSSIVLLVLIGLHLKLNWFYSEDQTVLQLVTLRRFDIILIVAGGIQVGISLFCFFAACARLRYNNTNEETMVSTRMNSTNTHQGNSGQTLNGLSNDSLYQFQSTAINNNSTYVASAPFYDVTNEQMHLNRVHELPPPAYEDIQW